jgi:hypothetical protein
MSPNGNDDSNNGDDNNDDDDGDHHNNGNDDLFKKNNIYNNDINENKYIQTLINVIIHKCKTVQTYLWLSSSPHMS